MASLGSATAATLEVRIAHTFADRPVQFGEFTATNAGGQTLSISRLSYLLSGFSLKRADGSATRLPDQFAFVDAASGRCSFALTNVPRGEFTTIEFHVGVDKVTNHRDPAGFAATHPLNPILNNLHWSWQGGFIFLAVEGVYRTGSPVFATAQRGFSYHLANDARLMKVTLPVKLAVNSDVSLNLALHVDRIWNGRHEIVINPATTSTHSRAGDELATQLTENIAFAFSIESAMPAPVPPRAAASGHGGDFLPPPPPRPRDFERTETPVQLPPGTTPYRLTFGRHLPIPDLPRGNPLSEEGVALGRDLFNDTILSLNGKQSCASCHKPDGGFVDAGRALSLGAEGQAGTRNAMPLFNLAWNRSFFWDGRARTLREQVLLPIQNPIEMHESLTNVVAKMTRAGTNYTARFNRAFGTGEVTSARVAMALEQFLLTLISHDSKFDRAMQHRETFSDEEQRGFELFFTEHDPRRGFFGADCFHCHGGPFLTNHRFADNGLDLVPKDAGRFDVTRSERDRGQFAVPSLRNVALTAPYMHDGRFKALEEVVAHYAGGVKRSANLDPNLAKHRDGGVQLSAADQRALVAFLKTLTDEKHRGNTNQVPSLPTTSPR